MVHTQKIENDEIMEDLRKADIRPSTARVHVLKYLMENRNHPTVDQIYRSLLETLPGLSRTSVYNTIGVLEGAGLVRPLTMDGSEMRYDAFTEDHAHFKCEECGTIFDIDVDIAGYSSKDLAGFMVRRFDSLFWGLCPHCAKQHAQS
jgi:Fe2+ or Zn2+ uptake regulation protein